MPRVNPANLRWARETAGLALDTAAKRLGINAARGFSADERLLRLEEGQDEPTKANLSKMASVYRRPLLAFYMAEPPPTEDRVEDFRTLPDHRPDGEALVTTLVRDVRARQALVRGVLEDDESPELKFVGSRRLADGDAAAAAALSRDIGFQLGAFRGAANADQAFAYLRQCAESAGVFVLLIGDLGSHHTELDTEAFRGFALSDPLAPFVVINDRDAHSAWSFTLLHELAHIWLGVTGVSGARGESRIEQFCNEVAGLILLPLTDVFALPIDAQMDALTMAAAVSQAANRLRVSRTMVALRLYQAGSITDAAFTTLRDQFRAEWLDARQRRRAERPLGGGGPDYFVVRRQRLGHALVELVGRAVRDGGLTPTKAGKVLGVRPRNVETLISGRAA